jgi:hypothetical protein
VHAKQNALLFGVFQKLLADPTKKDALAKFTERIQKAGQAAAAALREHCAEHPAIKKVLKALE